MTHSAANSASLTHAAAAEAQPPSGLRARTSDDAHDVANLVSAAQKGDRAALAGIHQRFAPLVHAVLLARVSLHDANDLTQDVFMLAMQKINSLRDPAAVGPWLMTIARRVAADHHRSRRKSATLDEQATSKPSPWMSEDVRQRAHAALDVIRSLPEAYRETLILRLVEGLTGPEIAICTGLSHGSVRVNLHRGMQLLRAALGEEGDKR